jgi:hypothetical protein
MGPKRPRQAVLTREEEALVEAFRKHTLLPLDDCLYALQSTILHLTRSTLHRCLQRHGISRLPDVRKKPEKRAFKKYPIGYFQVDFSTSTLPRCAPKKVRKDAEEFSGRGMTTSASGGIGSQETSHPSPCHLIVGLNY